MVFIDGTREAVRFDSLELETLRKCAAIMACGSKEQLTEIEKRIVATWEGAISSLYATNEYRVVDIDGKNMNTK